MRRAWMPLVAAAVAVAAPAQGQQGERFSLRGDNVAVHNLAGEVRVEPISGTAVEVQVVRGGSGARQLRVVRGEGERGAGEALKVIYPGDRIVYPRLGRGSRSTVGSRDGTFGGGRGINLRQRQITVAGTGSGVEAWADLVVRVPAGRTVTVHQGVGRVNVANVNGNLRVNTAAAAVRAERTRGSLSVDVGSGGVEVLGANGNVEVDTGSGAVRLTGIQGGSLLVDTGSGGVTGSDLRVGRLAVDVGSGSVRLDGVRAGEVDVDTGSGSVNVALAADAESVRIDTGSGGVTLTVPQSFGADVVIDTGSGGIDVDVPLTNRRASRSHLTGTIGDGRGRVEIDTGSGGVRLRRG